MDSVPIESPSNIATARELAKLASVLDGRPNWDRQCLLAAAVFLDADPPALLEAVAEISQGIGHAFRGTYVERRLSPRDGLHKAARNVLAT